MRLINVSTRMFEEFLGRIIPPYAILSHTWGDEEVTFSQYANPESRLLKGYEKIEQSCRLAAEKGIEYVWIDTCCIDKSSSAELSEAINSMYNWYKSAMICFVFLPDFEGHSKPLNFLAHASKHDPALRRFKKCKWFTRGWTLQEMLAPEELEFYDANWVLFGTKSEMIPVIAEITNIESTFFIYVQGASVAQKFSWAANRETTRVEDIAYCLLGLFDINMPLLYGEGDKAFKRLQLEILRSSDDESIFAWTDKGIWASGMLATSPSNFAHSGRIVPLPDLTLYRRPYQMTHQGLQIELEAFTSQERTSSPFEAYLRCSENSFHGHPEKLVALFIEPLEILPRVTRVRRVLPDKLEFRKFPETRNSQQQGNCPDFAEKGPFLIKDSRTRKYSSRDYEFSRFHPVRNFGPVKSFDFEQTDLGGFSLHLLHDSRITACKAERCSDGRDYVGVNASVFHYYKLDIAIIQLPRPACKLAHLELFPFPLIPISDEGVISQRVSYNDMLSQIQRGQLKPSLLNEGDQLLHQLAPFIDVFIARKPPSTTIRNCFELEMQVEFAWRDKPLKLVCEAEKQTIGSSSI